MWFLPLGLSVSGVGDPRLRAFVVIFILLKAEFFLELSSKLGEFQNGLACVCVCVCVFNRNLRHIHAFLSSPLIPV